MKRPKEGLLVESPYFSVSVLNTKEQKPEMFQKLIPL